MASNQIPTISLRICRLIRPLVLSMIVFTFAACQPIEVPSEAAPTAATDSEPATPVRSEPEAERIDENVPATAGLIQLRDPLDEPEFYCVDVPGFGRSLNLEGALTAHTCKPGADDEMFILNSPSPGLISMPAYNLCVEASGTGPGSAVQLASCADLPLQQFQYAADGRIRLVADSSQELCLTVAPEAGEPTGGPSHLRRRLTLEACDETDPARSSWTVGSPTVVTGDP